MVYHPGGGGQLRVDAIPSLHRIEQVVIDCTVVVGPERTIVVVHAVQMQVGGVVVMMLMLWVVLVVRGSMVIVATVVPSEGDLWKDRSPGRLSSSSAKSSSDWIGGSESVSRPCPCSSSSYTLSCERYGSGPGEEQMNRGGDRGIG
uniref:Uncharacterized protein n=1 Tax=Anopheles atroparvus TaxID=41427 RepID=A0A182JDN8_ANOAO